MTDGELITLQNIKDKRVKAENQSLDWLYQNNYHSVQMSASKNFRSIFKPIPIIMLQFSHGGSTNCFSIPLNRGGVMYKAEEQVLYTKPDRSDRTLYKSADDELPKYTLEKQINKSEFNTALDTEVFGR